MSDLGVAIWLQIAAVVVGLVPATYYPFMFLRVRWWESDIGKSMLLKGVALASVLWAGVGTLAAYNLGWAWYPWIQVLGNWLLTVAVTYQVVVMRRVQRSGVMAARMSDSRTGRGAGQS